VFRDARPVPPGSARPGGPPVPAGPPPEPSRGPLVVALVIVGVLSAAALFVSGYTLGLRGGPGGSQADEALRPFIEAYRRLTTEHVGRSSPTELVEGAIRGMFEVLDDPYSSYMTRQEYEQGIAGISGEFEGIGVEVSSEDGGGVRCSMAGPDCHLRIVRVLEGSPAERAGLEEGEAIVAVDGEAVAGESLDGIIARIRGPRGTPVRLTLAAGVEERVVEVIRDVIRTRTITSQVLADGRVGYVRVDGLGGRAAEDFRSALAAHLDAGIERILVDLRDDPGGYVDAAVSIASQFVPSGPIFWEEDASGRQVAVEAEGGGLATDPRIQVVVLVNRGTASASEIVAGALQDAGRATIVGETTFGKGSIQQWHLLPSESGGVRISVARWLTPAKRSIDGAGIDPDVAIERAGGPRGSDEDLQLRSAIDLLVADTSAVREPADERVGRHPAGARSA
jgi:carboxyl-terminal processing protease